MLFQFFSTNSQSVRAKKTFCANIVMVRIWVATRGVHKEIQANDRSDMELAEIVSELTK